MSKLLISESPLQVLPTLAAMVGLDEAIALQQVNYWVDLNQKAHNDRVFRDNRWWIYRAAEDWHKTELRFWSIEKIRRVFRYLEESGLLLSKQFEKSQWQRRKWYTVNYEAVDALEKWCFDGYTLKAGQRHKLLCSLIACSRGLAFEPIAPEISDRINLLPSRTQICVDDQNELMSLIAPHRIVLFKEIRSKEINQLEKKEADSLFSELTASESDVAEVSVNRQELSDTPVKVQDLGKECSAAPVEKIIQADFELMQPGEQQNLRLRGTAIALDPWILDAPTNQSKVLAGRVTRCDFNADFCVYLTQQLAQSPYWQERPDEPPVNSGLRQIKDLYAVLVGPQRDAEREKMQGLWDKWQESIAQRQRNEELRSAPTASVSTAAEEDERVPFSQLSEDQQAQIRATMAKLKTFASAGSTRMPQRRPVTSVPSALSPVEEVDSASCLEQIMSLPEGPVRDRELRQYRQHLGGEEAIASVSQNGMVSLQTLMPGDSFAQEGF